MATVNDADRKVRIRRWVGRIRDGRIEVVDVLERKESQKQ